MSGINIHNNIIYDNYGGIQGPSTAEDSGNNSYKNNLVFGNSVNFDLSSHSISQVSGTVNANPQFVNYVRAGGGDYRLQADSPAGQVYCRVWEINDRYSGGTDHHLLGDANCGN